MSKENIKYARNLKELHDIAKRYGAQFKYDSSKDYVEADCCGTYNNYNRKITVYKEKGDTWWSSHYYLVETFCHELAHHLQYEKRGFKRYNWRCHGFRKVLEFEWEADKMAYSLAKYHFPDMIWYRRMFWSYRDKKQKQYLYKHHFGEDIESISEFDENGKEVKII